MILQNDMGHNFSWLQYLIGSRMGCNFPKSKSKPTPKRCKTPCIMPNEHFPQHLWILVIDTSNRMLDSNIMFKSQTGPEISMKCDHR